MTNTMAVVIAVSRRDGQVTLRVSSRTCWRNLNGDVAIQYSRDRKCCSTIPSHGRLCAGRPINAGPQPRSECHDSNLQPPILEDGAANSIQYHWGDGEALHIGHFSKWQALTSASRVTVFRLVSESLGSKLGPSLPPVPRRIHELPKDQQTERNDLQAKNDKTRPGRINALRRSGRQIADP